MSILETYNSPVEIRTYTRAQLDALAEELRLFIIQEVSKSEGHLGSGLGVVELTVALYHCFDFTHDRIVWDVGHQAYPHKVLSGRKEQFYSNRKQGGLAGFPTMTESEYDHFGTGHSSTSISAIVGMMMADYMQDIQAHHIAVIGDASIMSGMAIEGLNHAGDLSLPILIILNDNNIGIDPSVGAIKKHLQSLEPHKENWFTMMQFDYQGPIDGHDLSSLVTYLERYKSNPQPTILHIKTTKGKGIKEAEKNQIVWHAPGKFDHKTGKLLSKAPQSGTKFQDVFGQTMLELAEANEKIVAITPAMPTGSSLNEMMQRFPQRAIDVGIAEQHALTLAAGMSARGLRPYVVIYSTFLQRAYDQLIHDIALQNLPVVICVDRAGLVGHDGATHQGVFDVAFSRAIPNIIIWNPKDEKELRQALYDAQTVDTPLMIRYPRGYGLLRTWQHEFNYTLHANVWLKRQEYSTVLVTTGQLSALDIQAEVDRLHLFQIKPIDKTIYEDLVKYEKIVVIEENSEMGGVAEYLSRELLAKAYTGRFFSKGIPDHFVFHASQAQQLQSLDLDAKGISEWLKKILC